MPRELPDLNASFTTTSPVPAPPAIFRDRTPIRFTTRSREMAYIQMEMDRLKNVLQQQSLVIDRLENEKSILNFENTCLQARYLLLQSNNQELKQMLGIEFSNYDDDVILTSDEEER